jgi:hypothetical protein
MGYSWSDSEGHYTVNVLPSGTYRVCVDANGTDYLSKCEDTPVTVITESTIVQDMCLGKGGSISGTITCEDCGEGTIEIVALQGADMDPSKFFGSLNIEGPGDYSMAGLPYNTQIGVHAWYDEEQMWSPPPDPGDYIGSYQGNPFILTESTSDLTGIDMQLKKVCTANDECIDGLFCNGAETCVEDVLFPIRLCQPGSDSCPEGYECNEDDDACYHVGCEVTLAVGEVNAHPGDSSVQVPVSMKNPSDKVLAIETVLLDEGNSSLTCDSCTPDPNRAPDFECFAEEQGDGSCKIIMVDVDKAALIAEAGVYETVFTVQYHVSQCSDLTSQVTKTVPPPCDPPEGCIEVGIALEDTIVVDESETGLEPICVEPPVEICFSSCGDVYPAKDCGDGEVNIFDILEEIDIVLGITEPSACQAEQANVPTSLPPECVDPDDDINLFDVLVIIDKALDNPNCCDAYDFQ